MIERRPGEITTLETRAAANEEVDRNLRYKQILEIMGRDKDLPFPGWTAKGLAVEMNRLGYTPTDERNFAAPRLTELGKRGVVEPIGKTTCPYTGRRVTVWGLCEREGAKE